MHSINLHSFSTSMVDTRTYIVNYLFLEEEHIGMGGFDFGFLLLTLRLSVGETISRICRWKRLEQCGYLNAVERKMPYESVVCLCPQASFDLLWTAFIISCLVIVS